MLDTQINIYSVDTGHFYSNHEKYLHEMNCRYKREQKYLENKMINLKKKISDGETDEKQCKKTEALIGHKKEKAKKSKERLTALLADKVLQNEASNGRHHIRKLRENELHDSDVVSIFESSLIRAIGLSENSFSDALIIVSVYYFDIFKDIAFYGFMYKGEKYIYFTSSAGQIRKKKAVFIKESIWLQIEKTVMCGLTIDKINSKGGNNVNKHLAYMALANSATDEWEGFDIDRCIVVEDFETSVEGTFDFIDEKDYSITRKRGAVPITHTDGAGMVLPSVMSRNAMFRAPWVKGLLGVFDFREFIREHNCSSVIADIYGCEHDVIKEDIQIILTKSQFKMYKFYDSWDEYKENFKKYNCRAGLCNIEEERIKNAKINYQMLQTLTDITDEEINRVAAKSVEKMTNICSSEETMKAVLGVTPYNTNMSPFQKSIKIYSPLLNDTYTKDILRDVKDSLLKKYRSGKLEINGKYTFLLPDYYAACEHWFGHIQNPKGLLDDNEVYCRLFEPYRKLDCLRSPHLYREHAIRINAAYRDGDSSSLSRRASSENMGNSLSENITDERKNKLKKWFITDALYTSTHDLISKMLQFDVDGDKSLVVADEEFIKIAERNMEGVVPLYYNMQKAKPEQLSSKNIYEGLRAAFTGGNIGVYSNNISKIWNSEVFISGTDEEKEHAVNCVKRLCCQNNFVIDYAKTLYKPEFPKEVESDIKKFTSCKLPAFFEFAKDKEKSQLEPRNKSFVNKLYEIIPDKPINTRGLKLEKPDFEKMMSNSRVVCPKEVSDLYDKLNREYRYKINMKEEYSDNLHFVAQSIREEFSKLGYSQETVCDMLVRYLYGNEKRSKQLLWFCYGQYIYNNLEKNIKYKKTKAIKCICCGEWVEVNLTSRACRCEACQREENRRIKREYKRKQKTI